MARKILSEKNIDVCVMKLTRIKPVPEQALNDAVGFKNIFFFEEGMLTGGIGEHFLAEAVKRGYNGKFIINAIDNIYVRHAKVDSLFEKLGLSADEMAETVLKNREDK